MGKEHTGPPRSPTSRLPSLPAGWPRRPAPSQARLRKATARRREEGAPGVYGDAAHGSGELLAYLDKAGIDPRVKVQPPLAPGGLFPKDRSSIDLAAGALTCPAGSTVAISFAKAGNGTACFGGACSNCPLRPSCTTAAAGRTVSISPHEELLRAQRERCAGPSFATDYRATRPKVERILAHLVLRRHGGRHARVRGRRKVGADFNLLAAARSLARLAVRGLRSTPDGWVAAGA
ncbi:MAG: transposase [Actinomycetota bacterium]|nr:transposase [Actinomycetota bacterium]